MFTDLIKAFFECCSKFLNYQTSKLDNLEKIVLLGDKKNLEKAGNIAEQIIEVADKYKYAMTRHDQRKLKSLIKKFNKLD